MRTSRFAFPVLCVWLLTSLAHAEEILSHLPANSLSFALIHDVESTNEKVVKFIEIFKEGLPAPLEMAQAMTGLSEGLDLGGEVLFALLPANEETVVPAPMFLLPVEDYATFAASIRADASGEICRVSIAEEDVLVARHGSYALLMNLEHRAIMQNLLSQPAEIPEEIKHHKKWIAGNDLSVMVTSAGIAYLAKASQWRLESANSPQAATDPGAQEIADDMLSLGDAFPFAELVEKQIETAGIGLALDDAINARLRWTVALKQTEGASGVDNTPAEEEPPLIGFVDQPYALAGGGPLPTELVALLPELCTQLSKDVSTTYDRADLVEQDEKELRKSYELAFSGLRGLSVLLTPVAEKEPLLSMFSTRLQVVDSEKYLESLEKSVELTNRIAERSTADIKLYNEVARVTIAQSEGFEITYDLDKATGDGNNHVWQTLLTSLLGIDHKLSIFCCAVDETHVVIGLESKPKLSEFIEAFRKRDTSLAVSAQAKKTLSLLQDEPRWLTLINPQGFVELVESAMQSMMILGFAPVVPDYPPAPPLVMALEHEEHSWRGELIMPVEAARAMAEFSKEVEKNMAQ